MKKFFCLMSLACTVAACSNSSKQTTKNTDSSSIESTRTASDSTVTQTDVKTEDSAKWDKMLDDYQAYIDDYVELMKKAKAGDMSAMTKSAELMSKAETLGKSMEDAKDSKFTPEQLQRFTEIQTKLLEAAAAK